jgi:hypothetical protein
MRATLLRCCAACVLIAVPAVTAVRAATPTDAEAAAQLQLETVQDRWQGRHSYLYDDEHQPGAETTGERPAEPRACVNEPIRLKRSDGSTVVRRFRRCD